MFRIGDFSKITGLPVRTLRFYQEKGLLLPTSVDEPSGYRYYDASSVEKARIIVALRALDFPLEEIGAILREYHDDTDIIAHLEHQRASLAARVRDQRKMMRTLDQLIRDEREARRAAVQASFQIQETTVGPMLVAGIRMKGRYSECGRGFGRLARAAGSLLCGKPFCLHYDDEYHEEGADFEVCVPVRKPVKADSVATRELPGARLVMLQHQGPYPSLGQSYAKLLAYMNQHGQTVARPTREVYLKGPGLIFYGNPKNFLTEIQLPVAE